MTTNQLQEMAVESIPKPSGTQPDCAPDYVERYRQSHLSPEDLEYRLAYRGIVQLDGLLRNYSYLDVGCGTGGYFRLLHNASRITGLDRSPRMLEAARELAPHLGYAHKVRFVQTEFPAFETDEKYDAIRLGVYGNYERVSVAALRRAHGMLNSGGFLLVGITPPTGVWGQFRNWLSRTAVVMSPARFERLVAAEGGFGISMAVRKGRRINYLLVARATPN